MREIKFRYRYTDGKEWIIKSFTLTEIINGDPFDITSDSPLFKGYVMNKYPDQYTGLKDRNGVEIYEGDMVRISFPDHEVGQVRFAKSYYGGQHGWLVINKDNRSIPDDFYGIWPDSEDIEVIGNIYEYPELLGDTK